MKLSLITSGLLDPKRLDSWVPEKRRAIRKAVEAGMKTAGKEIAQSAQSRMQSVFKVRKAGFVKSMRHKLYAGSPEKFPALLVGSRISWLGIHVQGGTIGGRMLIPLLPEHQRIGRKAFRRVIDGLMRAGNAFFIEKNGKVILMAENIKDNTSELRRFKRAERGRTGAISAGFILLIIVLGLAVIAFIYVAAAVVNAVNRGLGTSLTQLPQTPARIAAAAQK